MHIDKDHKSGSSTAASSSSFCLQSLPQHVSSSCSASASSFSSSCNLLAERPLSGFALPAIDAPIFFGEHGILQKVRLLHRTKTIDQQKDIAHTIQGLQWEEIVEPIVQSWLINNDFMSLNLPYVYQQEKGSKHDFIFKAREQGTCGLIEVKSTHGKPDDMVINASKFDGISGDLFIVDCTSAGVWIMRCEKSKMEAFRSKYQLCDHPNRKKGKVYYIPHAHMMQIAVCKQT